MRPLQTFDIFDRAFSHSSDWPATARRGVALCTPGRKYLQPNLRMAFCGTRSHLIKGCERCARRKRKMAKRRVEEDRSLHPPPSHALYEHYAISMMFTDISSSVCKEDTYVIVREGARRINSHFLRSPQAVNQFSVKRMRPF